MRPKIVTYIILYLSILLYIMLLYSYYIFYYILYYILCYYVLCYCILYFRRMYTCNSRCRIECAQSSNLHWRYCPVCLLFRKIALSKRLRQVCFVIGIILFVFAIGPAMQVDNAVMQDTGIRNGVYQTKWPKSVSTDARNNVTILLWSTFMKDVHWSDFYGSFDSYKCEYKCKYTFNRGAYNQSQLVVFNARRMYKDHETLPHRMRRNRDVWMIHGTEPPRFIYLNMANYQHIFNWTSFPRPDSDIRTYYNNYVEITSDLVSARHKMEETVESFSKRHKMIGWIVSHCHTDNHREEYVKQMMQHVTVHIYGKCGSASLIGSTLFGITDDVIQQHKFYLAFENSNCLGYISEKLWNPLREGAIPVVMGNSASYKRYAPPGSYIDTSLFDTAEELVKYIHTVAMNETLYRSYFKWISKYKIVNTYWCDMCRKVHQWDGVPQVYSDLQGWYSNDTCSVWTVCISFFLFVFYL